MRKILLNIGQFEEGEGGFGEHEEELQVDKEAKHRDDCHFGNASNST